MKGMLLYEGCRVIHNLTEIRFSFKNIFPLNIVLLLRSCRAQQNLLSRSHICVCHMSPLCFIYSDISHAKEPEVKISDVHASNHLLFRNAATFGISHSSLLAHFLCEMSVEIMIVVPLC